MMPLMSLVLYKLRLHPKSKGHVRDLTKGRECFHYAVPATVAASGLELSLPFS